MRCNLNVPVIAPNGGSIFQGNSPVVTNQSSLLPIVPIPMALPPHGNKNLYIFTDCGLSSGRFGPSEEMCNQTYKNTNVKVRVTDGIQRWIVPQSGRYKIEARGPAGQQHLQRYAGRGATVSGEFDLDTGIILKVR